MLRVTTKGRNQS